MTRQPAARLLVGAAAAATALLVAACHRPTRSEEANAILSDLRTRFGNADVLRPGAGRVDKADARVTLPSRANAPMVLEEMRTGMRVQVALGDARDVVGQSADGYLVYPDAHASSGATLLHRALPDGAEDFVSFKQRPRAEAVVYRVDVGQGVRGLRLVDNTLELLDAGGAPRLRVLPPYIVGADGARADAMLAVEGCAVDTSRAPPWDRPVTPPGAESCAVRVSWEGRSVTYPALLDPRWTTTASMATARQEHTATLLSNGKVLVAGGRSGTSTTALSSAELYDRTTGSWTSAGNITAPAGTNAPRRLHTAVELGTTSNPNTSGRVLVAGGINGTTTVITASLYNVTANTWAPAASMNVARHEHTATRAATGNVVVIGGVTNTTVLNTAAIYNPGGTGTGTWSAVTNTMSSPRRGHTATLLVVPGNPTLNNRILVVGGNSGGTANVSVNTAQVFTGPATWTGAGTLSGTREGHTATALANGNVLVAGGKSVATGGATTFLQSTQVFNVASGSGSWTATAGTMVSRRIGHSATLLPSTIATGGKVVLVVGGSTNGTDTVNTAEVWDGVTGWAAAPALSTSTPTALGAVKGHAAILLGSNAVLIAGGVNGTTPQTAAGLYDASFGVACTSNSQCVTGFCVNGVCCNSACTNPCSACNLTGLVGTCSPRPNGAACSDGNACTQTDTCQAGTCAGANPVTCTAQDQCHVAGTCVPATGACSNPAKANGTACNDGNACTRTDTCQAGACAGANPVACFQMSQCHDAGVCDPATGVCSLPPKPEGTPCNDSDACTQTDFCQLGTCVGTSPVTCPNPDQCHFYAGCDSTTGLCGNPSAPDGTACNDANACTRTDTCQAGACTGANPVACFQMSQCHNAGVCDPASGVCSLPPKPEGTPCNDSDACTQTDFCQLGTCVGTSPVTCPNPDQCHFYAGCDSTTGLCGNPSAPDGTACNDANACTQTDTCQAGACTGASPVQCGASDACHGPGVCNPGTGTCSNPPVLAGTCQPAAFDYDRAGRLVRDRGATLIYDGYDQLREVRPGPGGPPALVNLPVDDLGTFGGHQTIPADVNVYGHVVGMSYLADGTVHGFLASGQGPLIDLKVRAGVTTNSFLASGINDSGVVTGHFEAPDGYHVFRFDPDGPFQDLGRGGGDFAVSWEINVHGDLAGLVTAGALVHGFKYSDGAGFQNIGTLGGDNSWAWGIDASGSVVASAQVPGSPSTGFERFGHAAIFSDIVGLQDLNGLADTSAGWTLVVANRRTGDWITGAGFLNGVQTAYRLRLSTGVVDEVRGWAGLTNGFAVNSFGEVVGTGTVDAAGTQLSPFFYSDQTGFKNLNDLIDPASGWILQTGSGINDSGDVIGWGYHNGVVSAYRVRLPLRNTTSGGPVVAVAHTYGFDGLRTSTSTGVGTPSPTSQYWFTQDYTERNGQREHYVRIGDRLIARVTLQENQAAMGAGVTREATGRRSEVGGNGPRLALGLMLFAVGALSAAFGVVLGRRRRHRWAPALAGLTSMACVILGGVSCDTSGDSRGSALWSIVDNLTLYFHNGLAPGPNVITDHTGALSEERRYEPFGQPLDAYRPGAGVVPVDLLHDPQNILGKQTDPNTGWSYHGARWMAPQTARWLTPDPAVKGPDGKHMLTPWDLNPYAFVAGNPVVYWDPDGRRKSWRDEVPLAVEVLATVFGAAFVLDWAQGRAHAIEDNPGDPLEKAKVVVGAPLTALDHAKSTAKRADALSRSLDSATRDRSEAPKEEQKALGPAKEEQKALGPAEESKPAGLLQPPPQVEARWGASWYKKGGWMNGLEHIMYRHGPNSGWQDAGKFAAGTTPKNVMSLVDEALRYGTVMQTGPDKYRIEYDMGRVIGKDRDDNAASSLRVEVRDGIVQTAYPY